MATHAEHDVIIVGGGLAGSSLAANLARHGLHVLVLERETRFTDRVRGEQMHPWGVTEARTLDIYDTILDHGGLQTRFWTIWAGGAPIQKRDLVDTTPHRAGSLHFYHPEIQDALLALAAAEGADVQRGVTVDSIVPGALPRVTLQREGSAETLAARLVVAADGRNSRARSWCGYASRHDPERLMIAGTLLESTSVPDDGVHLFLGPGAATLFAPQGAGRTRVYVVHVKAAGLGPFSGDGRIPVFLDQCHANGVPDGWLSGAVAAGPLAEYSGANSWVDHPAGNGVALIGDAAAAPDPSWGSGLSLTLMDVRHLRDALRATDDWDAATSAYARAHDEYYGVLRRIEHWMATLVWDQGPEADTRRARVMPRMLDDPTGLPDITGLGPGAPVEPTADRLLFGEEGLS